MSRLRRAMTTSAGTAVREAAGAVAGIGSGAFILDTVNDPVAQVLAFFPIVLGAASLIECFRTIASIRRTKFSAAEADVVHFPRADTATEDRAAA